MNNDVEVEINDFLKKQKLLILATVGDDGSPWTCNVYYSVSKNGKLFFVSSPNTEHSQHLEKNKNISFSVAWYDGGDLSNRKAVQGRGKCEKVTGAKETIQFLSNHYQYYPLWKDVITHEKMRKNAIESRPYIINPTYMKYWNDELFGDEGIREIYL